MFQIISKTWFTYISIFIYIVIIYSEKNTIYI